MLKWREKATKTARAARSNRALGKMHAIEGKNVLLAALREKDAVINREALSALELILDRDEFNRTEKSDY